MGVLAPEFVHTVLSAMPQIDMSRDFFYACMSNVQTYPQTRNKAYYKCDTKTITQIHSPGQIANIKSNNLWHSWQARD
jgi:hypothetical protein